MKDPTWNLCSYSRPGGILVFLQNNTCLAKYCGNGRFRPGRMDPEPYDVRANSHIWRIEPEAHRIYSGQETSVLAFCRVLLPEKHSYKATLEGKNPILLQWRRGKTR